MPVSRFTPSYTLTEDRLAQLKQVVPEAFADGKINWETLREVLGEHLEEEGQQAERFGLFWPGKREARRAAAMPPQGALYPAPGEGVNEDTTRHVFIEGENLEVLKLLRKAYAGRVKMIYIDPPYNTGSDLIYCDDYAEPVEAYLRRTGQTGEKGELLTTNPKSAGRYHSLWLSMLLPRLVLARELLSDDGVIWVSIDDNEARHLQCLLGEVFGENNFLACVVWNSTKSVTNTALVSVSHNFHLVYAKNIEYFVTNRSHFRIPESGEGFGNPDNDPRGPWKADPYQVGGWRPNQQYEIVNPKTGRSYRPNPGCSWKNDYETYLELVKDKRIVFGATGDAGPQRKRFLSEALERGRVVTTWWDDVGTTASGTRSVQELFDGVGVFSNPKPVDLIERMLQLGDHTQQGIILDFFAGSCTTGDAVLRQNAERGLKRRFLLVQLPEMVPQNEKDYEAVRKWCEAAGIPQNFAEIGKERVRRVIARIQQDQHGRLHLQGGAQAVDLGFRVYKLGRSQFKRWQPREGESVQEVQARFAQFESPLVEGWDPEALRVEVMLQEGFPLDSRVERVPEVGSNSVQRITSDWCEHRLFVCFDARLTDETVERLPRLMGAQDILVCLDRALTDESKMRLDDRCNVHVI